MSLATCSVQAAKTLNDLTLEEKIGQMMQLVTDLFGTNDAQGVFHIDRAKADINNLYTREMVARDKKDALRIAINAGIDMIMEPYTVDACILLKELVEEGKIP